MNKLSIGKKYIFPLLLSLFTAALFLKNAEFTMCYVRQGLESCFLTIIPSLFPFMVIAEIFCECGAPTFLGGILGEKSEVFFGISRKSLAAIFAGLLLGFPIGTRALIGLYDKNEVSQEELTRAIGFCGIPSFGFIVNVMGISVFHDKLFGLTMYVCAFLSAVISGLVFSKKENLNYMFVSPPPQNKKSSTEIITGAISSATGATITLCAYVVFFSCIVGCITSSGINRYVSAAIGAVLELSAGVASSADVGGIASAVLCGFAIGWSGLSVHFQTMALLSDRVKSYKKYFLQKLFQGLICALAALAFALATDFSPKAVAIPSFNSFFTPEYAVISITLFFVCLVATKKELFPIKK